MTRLSDKQVRFLAEIERSHTHLIRINDEHPLGDVMLKNELTGTAAFFCARCGCFITLDVDGFQRYWVFSRLHGCREVPSDHERQGGDYT